jgi:hypothetical protein
MYNITNVFAGIKENMTATLFSQRINKIFIFNFNILKITIHFKCSTKQPYYREGFKPVVFCSDWVIFYCITLGSVLVRRVLL